MFVSHSPTVRINPNREKERDMIKVKEAMIEREETQIEIREEDRDRME